MVADASAHPPICMLRLSCRIRRDAVEKTPIVEARGLVEHSAPYEVKKNSTKRGVLGKNGGN